MKVKLTKKEKIILELNRYEGCFQSGINEDGTIDNYYTGIHEQFTEIKHLLQVKGYSVPVVKKRMLWKYEEIVKIERRERTSKMVASANIIMFFLTEC